MVLAPLREGLRLLLDLRLHQILGPAQIAGPAIDIQNGTDSYCLGSFSQAKRQRSIVVCRLLHCAAGGHGGQTSNEQSLGVHGVILCG